MTTETSHVQHSPRLYGNSPENTVKPAFTEEEWAQTHAHVGTYFAGYELEAHSVPGMAFQHHPESSRQGPSLQDSAQAWDYNRRH